MLEQRATAVALRQIVVPVGTIEHMGKMILDPSESSHKARPQIQIKIKMMNFILKKKFVEKSKKVKHAVVL